MTDIQKLTLNFYTYADYVPLVSTCSNAFDIIFKFVLDQTKTPIYKRDYYFIHIKEKSYFRCITLLVPILGNIAILLYDLYKLKKGVQPTSPTVSPKEQLRKYLMDQFPTLLQIQPKKKNEIPIPKGYENDPEKMKVFETIRDLPRKQRTAECPIEYISTLKTARTEANLALGMLTIHPKVDPKDIRKGGIRIIKISDVSGSMGFHENAGIEALKKATLKLGSVLRPEDQLFEMTYTEQATPFFAPAYMTKENLDKLDDQADNYKAWGGTMIMPALNFAFDCIRYANAIDAEHNVFVPTLVLPFSDGDLQDEGGITMEVMSNFADAQRSKGLDTSSVIVTSFGLGKDAKLNLLGIIAKEFRGKCEAADFENFGDKMVEATQAIQSTVFQPTSLMIVTKGNVKIKEFHFQGKAEQVHQQDDMTIWKINIGALPSNGDRHIHFSYEGSGQLYQFCHGINMISGKEESFDTLVDLPKVEDLQVSKDSRFTYSGFQMALKEISNAQTLEKQKEALSTCFKFLSASNWPWLSAMVKLANIIDDPIANKYLTILKTLKGAVTPREKIDALFLCMQNFSETAFPWIKQLDFIKDLLSGKTLDDLEAAVNVLQEISLNQPVNTSQEVYIKLQLGLLSYICREITGRKYHWLDDSFRDIINQFKAIFPIPNNFNNEGPFELIEGRDGAFLKSKSVNKELCPKLINADQLLPLIDLYKGLNFERVRELIRNQKAKGKTDEEYARDFAFIPNVDNIINAMLENVTNAFKEVEQIIIKNKVPPAILEAAKCSADLTDCSDIVLRAREIAMEAESQTGGFLHGNNIFASNLLLGKGHADAEFTLKPNEIVLTKHIMEATGLTGDPALLINKYLMWYVVRPTSAGPDRFALSYLVPNTSLSGGLSVRHEIYKVLQDKSITNDNEDSVNRGKNYKNLSDILEDLQKPLKEKQKDEQPKKEGEKDKVAEKMLILCRYYNFYQGVTLGLPLTAVELSSAESLSRRYGRVKVKPPGPLMLETLVLS